MICQECKQDYPESLLSPMQSSTWEGNSRLVCGICALEITNKIHGDKRKKFAGTVAELMRKEAIQWRKKRGNP